MKIKSKVPFKPNSFMLVNKANPHDQHESDGKSAFENLM